MLGRAICRALVPVHEVTATSRRELDVTDAAAVRDRVAGARPQWVVHLAALTDVDRCEREPARAAAVNTTPVQTLAEVCDRAGSALLLLSSIAVFDGRKEDPYVESDAPGPINTYGRTKEAAERAARAAANHLVVRTGWLFSGDAHDHKFVGRIVELARTRQALDVVDDAWGSPTWVAHLAQGIVRLLSEDARGLVHLVNEGRPASRVELARAALAAVGLSRELRPVPSQHFPGLAPRPRMEAARSHRTAGWLPQWELALSESLRNAG